MALATNGISYIISWPVPPDFPIKDDSFKKVCHEIIRSVCNDYSYEINNSVAGLPIKIGGPGESIVVCVSHINDTIAPADIARTLKSQTSSRFVIENPILRQYYMEKGHLWGEGWVISSAKL